MSENPSKDIKMPEKSEKMNDDSSGDESNHNSRGDESNYVSSGDETHPFGDILWNFEYQTIRGVRGINFRNLTHIRKQFKNYSFHRKIQYVWLSVLTAAGLVILGIKGVLF